MTTTYTAAPAVPISSNDRWEDKAQAGNMDSVRYFHSSRSEARSRSRSASQRIQSGSLAHDNDIHSHSSSEHLPDHATRSSRRPSGAAADEDDSAWIHRDKLARIESKEMQEAGLGMRPFNSKSLPGRNRSDWGQNSTKAQKPKRVPRYSAPINTNGLIETSGFGFEDAEDSNPGDAHSTSRPGTSRIPINKNSPVPLSSSYTDRDSPLGRSSGASNDLQVAKNLRPRSQSLGGEAAFKETATPDKQRPVSSHMVDSPLLSESSDSSARAQKRVNLKVKSPASRNDSVKSRVVSGGSLRDSPDARPKSRARPHSIHRPEGEAPWLATMYKPDPMLPPDQQILPTHAKKMMQEQWAREGKHGDAYDRNFNQLNSNDMMASRPATAATLGANDNTLDNPDIVLTTSGFLPPQSPPPRSPLPELPPSIAGSRQNSHTGSRQGSQGGGYRITPFITPTHSPAPPGSQRSPQKQSDAERISAVPPIPQKSLRRDGGDDDIELQNEPMVHRLDLTKLASRKSELEQDDDKGGCGLKCIVM